MREALPAATPRPAAGDRVRHTKFGDGKIVAIAGEGADAKYTIDFDTEGQKVLLAKFVAPIA